MNKAVIAMLGLALLVGGCATTPDDPKQQVAQDKQEVYCQTDDSTGSRLAKRTVCTGDDDSGDAQQAVRDIQTRALTSGRPGS